MIVRSDHIAGGVFAAVGVGIMAISGDLPTGTLSFPGAGMMPKLVAGLLIVFACLIGLRGGESGPIAEIGWNDLPHAARVIATTALAVILYQALGFAITMALMLFALTFLVEGRRFLPAA